MRLHVRATDSGRLRKRHIPPPPPLCKESVLRRHSSRAAQAGPWPPGAAVGPARPRARRRASWPKLPDPPHSWTGRGAILRGWPRRPTWTTRHRLRAVITSHPRLWLVAAILLLVRPVAIGRRLSACRGRSLRRFITTGPIEPSRNKQSVSLRAVSCWRGRRARAATRLGKRSTSADDSALRVTAFVGRQARETWAWEMGCPKYSVPSADTQASMPRPSPDPQILGQSQLVRRPRRFLQWQSCGARVACWVARSSLPADTAPSRDGCFGFSRLALAS